MYSSSPTVTPKRKCIHKIIANNFCLFRHQQSIVQWQGSSMWGTRGSTPWITLSKWVFHFDFDFNVSLYCKNQHYISGVLFNIFPTWCLFIFQFKHPGHQTADVETEGQGMFVHMLRAMLQLDASRRISPCHVMHLPFINMHRSSDRKTAPRPRVRPEQEWTGLQQQ